MSHETDMKLAAALYAARDTAKRLSPPAIYRARIGEFSGIIRETMTEDGLDVLAATASLCDQIHDEQFLTLWFLAAAVEILEPSI